MAVSSASAGAFSVSPVRIHMLARERATAITIQNEDDSELVMQAEIFSWRQKADGSDELTPTDDLILAPPILKVPPRTQQVVRLANLRPVLPGEQQTYRLVIREVPEAKPAQGPNVQIRVALAFSLPIFITPPGAQRKLECEVRRSAADTAVAVCSNQGQAYAQPVAMELLGTNGERLLNAEIRGGYILPQIRRSFDLPKAAAPLPVGPAKLTVTQDDGSKQTFDVRLAE